MLFSIFTPTNNLVYIYDTAHSVHRQTYSNFEWVILLNGNLTLDDDKIAYIIKLFKDTPNKLKIVKEDNTGVIGYLKKKCCDLSSGHVLVELDHDDTLEPNCLEELHKTFSDNRVDFAYSDCYEYKDGTSVKPFSEKYGWKYTLDETGRYITHSFDPTPTNFSYIWHAPNHVRAWRSTFYKKIGGHDTAMDVCDDHDIVCRTFINGKCVRIPKPLYRYNNRTGVNTCYGQKNKKIQELTKQLHDKYIEQMVMKWCTDNNLIKADLCCSHYKRPGYLGVDIEQLPGVDIVCDLDKPAWPFNDGSVGLFRMQDAIEHMKDPINTMKELYRCLAPNGWVLIEVPSTDGRGAFQDPTHVSFWNSNSFWYYTKRNQAQYIGTPVKFQLNRILDYFPSEWHKLHNIPYVKAHLVKLPDDNSIPPGGRDI